MPQGVLDQGEAFDQRGGELQFPVGGGGGPGQAGGDLVGGPLEPFRGPGHGLVGFAVQIGEGDGVGDLDQLGEQQGLLVRQLPRPGLQHLDPPRVRHPGTGQLLQEGSQLRAGRECHRPVGECCHPGHDSNMRSHPDRTGAPPTAPSGSPEKPNG
ncbi:hypothetical protein [Pseudonocardia zijingensis]|uniref:Uncharacterized protein n=1 Tax=Pseudonocardia zijingensis TaxID=153376 RepID=A0ABN1NIZ2_9PSEU